MGSWDVVYCSTNKGKFLPSLLSLSPSYEFALIVLAMCIDADAVATAASYVGGGGAHILLYDVKCEITRADDVYIPIPSLPPHPANSNLFGRGEEEAVEDWNVEMGALFEWVGMACLGAQRHVSRTSTLRFMTLT